MRLPWSPNQDRVALLAQRDRVDPLEKLLVSVGLLLRTQPRFGVYVCQMERADTSRKEGEPVILNEMDDTTPLSGIKWLPDGNSVSFLRGSDLNIMKVH